MGEKLRRLLQLANQKQRYLWDKIFDWWWFDVILASVVCVLAIYVVSDGSKFDILGRIDLALRQNIYTDLIQLSIIFAGFSSVSFTIFLSSGNSYVVRLRESETGAKIVQIWVAALSMPWVSAFVVIVAKIYDSGGAGSSNPARWFAFSSVLLIVLQMLRLVWVLYRITHLETKRPVPTRKTAASMPRIRRVPPEGGGAED